jgi:hypothetical protein
MSRIRIRLSTYDVGYQNQAAEQKVPPIALAAQ